MLDAATGQFAAASKQLDEAAKLDADDPAIAEARSQINQQERIDPLVFNKVLLQGAASQFFKVQHIR